PDFLASLCVDCDQSSIEGAEEQEPLRRRDAAIYDVTTCRRSALARNFGIELPQQLARARVDRLYFAPCACGVHLAIDDQRRRFLAAMGVQIERPRESQLSNVLGRDGRERRETLFGIGAAMSQPVAGILLGLDDASGIDLRRRVCVGL